MLATLAVGSLSGAQARQSSAVPAATGRCIALPLPSVRGADGSATDFASSLRDLVSSFLSGPSLRTVAIDARLAAQAAEEAQQKQCGTVLTITLTRKQSGGGAFSRVAGDAASSAAWHLPYGATAASTVTRSAAIAGASAVSSIAQNTRAKDELQIEYRLSSGKATLRDGKDSTKARSDGEDLVTPLVERMANVVAAEVAK